jgi:putative transposase
MIKNKELRHRVKQMPLRGTVSAVRDRALERGSMFLVVSAYRNSRVCPLHGEELQFPDGPKLAQCPRHVVHRDLASPLNMLRKPLEEG